MNAITMLKDDHNRVKDLFTKIEPARNRTERRKLFNEIRSELLLHMELEETQFYPLFSENREFGDLIDEALDEHQEIKDIIAEMRGTRDDNDFDDLLEDLIDAVTHHVNEEEKDIFLKVEKTLNPEELERLGFELEKSRREHQAAA